MTIPFSSIRLYHEKYGRIDEIVLQPDYSEYKLGNLIIGFRVVGSVFMVAKLYGKFGKFEALSLQLAIEELARLNRCETIEILLNKNDKHFNALSRFCESCDCVEIQRVYGKVTPCLQV